MAYDLARAPAQVARSKTYQDYLDEDRGRVPDHFRIQGDDDGGADPPPVEHYISRAFYERERTMWEKTCSANSFGGRAGLCWSESLPRRSPSRWASA